MGGYSEYASIIDPWFTGNDFCRIGYDYVGYSKKQKMIDREFQNQKWYAKCLNPPAGTGFFTTDRTMTEYSTQIWKVKPVPMPKIPAENKVFKFGPSHNV
ncbi:MAG: hypothetical protein CUN57_04110, partial [Phototrophicales bacterium]